MAILHELGIVLATGEDFVMNRRQTHLKDRQGVLRERLGHGMLPKGLPEGRALSAPILVCARSS